MNRKFKFKVSHKNPFKQEKQAKKRPSKNRFGTHYETIPHDNCQDPAHCDCDCPGCARAEAERKRKFRDRGDRRGS